MPVKNKHRSRNKAAAPSPPKASTQAESGLRSKHPYRSPKIKTPKIVDINQNSRIEPFPDLEYDSYETQDLDGLISLVTFHVGKSKGYGAFLLPTLRRAFLNACSGIDERIRFAKSAMVRCEDFDRAYVNSPTRINDACLWVSLTIARNLHRSIGRNLQKMLKGDKDVRANEARKIKALLCEAIDQLSSGEKWEYPANKSLVEISYSHFIEEHTAFPASKGWTSFGELLFPTDLPIACVAIECARNLTAALRRLPTKNEVKFEIINLYSEYKSSGSLKEIETLSDPMWTKIWEEAGLKSLKRGGKWRPRITQTSRGDFSHPIWTKFKEAAARQSINRDGK